METLDRWPQDPPLAGDTSPQEPTPAADDGSQENGGGPPVSTPTEQGVITRLPVVRGLTPRVTLAGTPLVLSGSTAITVSDPEGASPRSLEITLVASHGTLSLARTDGLDFFEGEAVGAPTMRFTGRADAITAALDGLTFVPEGNYSGEATVCVGIGYATRRADTANLCADHPESTDHSIQDEPRAALSMRITVMEPRP